MKETVLSKQLSDKAGVTEAAFPTTQTDFMRTNEFFALQQAT
jgi:hypothetical protein